MAFKSPHQKIGVALGVIGVCLTLFSGCSDSGSGSDAPSSHQDVTDSVPPALRGGAETPATSHKKTRLHRIRVASYNINWSNPRLGEVLEAIRRSNADVVCLQEATPESASVIRREFAQRYGHIRFCGSIERYAGGGFGLLSRFPVKSETFLPAEHGLFGTCLTDLQNGDQTIQVINVHLQPVNFDSHDGTLNLSTVLRGLHAAEQVHRKEIERLMPHVSSELPSLIMGDFNSCSTFQAPVFLANNGFIDSFATVNDNADSKPTWHWPTKYGEVALRIDYVFHSPAFRTLDSQVIKTEGSDHYLLLSTLESVDSLTEISSGEPK